eukprot:TRINITY_DN1941_c0_g1_i12.p1 TRINITY_DN1941_c0_g1~~TRINITY_DN1941_c0_g1_i12.p1  ORF type:complete len:197 (-),score=31.93 TRINITY_DN1941_c0_g1_i12:27-617(-)
MCIRDSTQNPLKEFFDGQENEQDQQKPRDFGHFLHYGDQYDSENGPAPYLNYMKPTSRSISHFGIDSEGNPHSDLEEHENSPKNGCSALNTLITFQKQYKYPGEYVQYSPNIYQMNHHFDQFPNFSLDSDHFTNKTGRERDFSTGAYRYEQMARNLTKNTSRYSSRLDLSLIHISEPTRLLSISYAVFCLKKKKKT